MYGIFKDVIKRGDYELTNILKKINTLWAENELTDEQREELIALARENADPKNSYASLQNQIATLFENVKELAQEILALKNGGVLPEVETEEYPEYVQPTGAHDAYNTGDKMTFNGKKYICKKDVCVWNPDDYPQGWELVTEDIEEESEELTKETELEVEETE